MYTVSISTTRQELGELVSLVGTMKNTSVVSVDSVKDEPAPVIKVIAKRRKSVPSDYVAHPDRLVYDKRPNGTSFINVSKSLEKLGLDRGWLLKNHTKAGTPEHALKMSIKRRKDLKA